MERYCATCRLCFDAESADSELGDKKTSVLFDDPPNALSLSGHTGTFLVSGRIDLECV